MNGNYSYRTNQSLTAQNNGFSIGSLKLHILSNELSILCATIVVNPQTWTCVVIHRHQSEGFGEDDETKFLHRQRPLAMSTKVQNPDSMAERTLENRLGEFLGSWWVSSSAVSNWGGSDLRFLRMKKPARVAERKTRMNLRGHISVLNLSDGSS